MDEAGGRLFLSKAAVVQETYQLPVKIIK